jgi:hypothetical protein
MRTTSVLECAGAVVVHRDQSFSCTDDTCPRDLPKVMWFNLHSSFVRCSTALGGDGCLYCEFDFPITVGTRRVDTRAKMTDLEELDESECWDLLAQVTVGRLGLHFGAIPRIVPMNFTMFDKRIVVCTAIGAAVTDALHDSVVAFQVDDFHLNNHEGWSVVAVGPSARVTDLRTLNAMAGLPTEPWTPCQRQCVTQIEPQLISGRRFVQRTPTEENMARVGGR